MVSRSNHAFLAAQRAPRLLLLWPAKQPQPSDTAVRKNVEPHVGRVADRAQLVFEDMPRVWLQPGTREQRAPALVIGGAGAAFEAARARRVALEVAGVGLDSLDDTCGAQAGECPSVTVPAAR